MFETAEEIDALQELLDRSHSASTQHLRNIITPGRTLSAENICALLTGMRVLNLATVTAKAEPRISAVDGHFLNGRWTFTTSGTAAKARQLRARPAASAAYVDGERVGIFTHGQVEFLEDGTPEQAALDEYLTGFYDSSPKSWGEHIVFCRIRPTWMVGYAFNKAEATR
jgi:pyridoxamine 5'-phosphate oxidase-like protein